MQNTIWKLFILLLLFSATEAYSQVNYQVTKVKFEGNEALKSEQLAAQMNTRDMNLQERIFFWKKTPRYSTLILENDLDRLKSFYQRNGFLQPKISHTLQQNDKKEKLSILIKVEEGQPVILSKINFREHGSAATGNLEKFKKELSLKEGSRFADKDIFTASATLKQAYHNNGYPFASVRNEVKLPTDSTKATVTFHITPGEKATFGAVHFQGDSLVQESLLQRQIKFKQGDPYAQNILEQSQQEIFETGLFSYAIIRTQKDSLRNGSLPILVRVQELPQWSFEGGIGYGTEDRFRISVELIKRQFLGGARKLILQGKRSYFLPISLDAKFIQPDFLNQEVDFALNPFFTREREESYEVDRLGTVVTVQKKYTKTFSSYLTYSLQQDNLLDKTLAAGDTAIPLDEIVRNKSGVTLGLTKNSTDNIFEPTKGWRLNGYFTYMGLGFKSDYQYYQFGVDARHYRSLGRGYIAAGRLQAGVIAPLQERESTPIEDRYLIGGATSLRGWARNSISPRDDAGEATGGNSMLQSSVELRFPIYKIITGTGFVDVGNVWREEYQFDLSDLYYNVGTGLRVKTPIGPIRLDVAFPLFQGAFDAQFFISLGHAF